MGRESAQFGRLACLLSSCVLRRTPTRYTASIVRLQSIKDAQAPKFLLVTSSVRSSLTLFLHHISHHLPLQLLGIPTNADSNTINRLYKQKLFEAKTDEQKAAIESAHSAIMMNLLTRRVKGGSPVDKDIQFADKVRIENLECSTLCILTFFPTI